MKSENAATRAWNAGGAEKDGPGEPTGSVARQDGRFPDRLSIPERAGSRMHHDHTERIYATNVRSTPSLVGLFDRSTRIFQCGGEESGFIYWKENLITLPREAWSQVKDRAELLEWVDNTRNKVYRVDIDDARRHGRAYSAGIGRRWGCPLDYATVERGELKPARVTADREEPARAPRASSSQLTLDFGGGA